MSEVLSTIYTIFQIYNSLLISIYRSIYYIYYIIQYTTRCAPKSNSQPVFYWLQANDKQHGVSITWAARGLQKASLPQHISLLRATFTRPAQSPTKKSTAIQFQIEYFLHFPAFSMDIIHGPAQVDMRCEDCRLGRS